MLRNIIVLSLGMASVPVFTMNNDKSLRSNNAAGINKGTLAEEIKYYDEIKHRNEQVITFLSADAISKQENNKIISELLQETKNGNNLIRELISIVNETKVNNGNELHHIRANTCGIFSITTISVLMNCFLTICYLIILSREHK